jgi:hypothetical protein
MCSIIVITLLTLSFSCISVFLFCLTVFSIRGFNSRSAVSVQQLSIFVECSITRLPLSSVLCQRVGGIEFTLCLEKDIVAVKFLLQNKEHRFVQIDKKTR